MNLLKKNIRLKDIIDEYENEKRSSFPGENYSKLILIDIKDGCMIYKDSVNCKTIYDYYRNEWRKKE